MKEHILQTAGERGIIVHEPVVVTTRPQRNDDGVSRRAGVSSADFALGVANGSIVLDHRPFGTHSAYQYGFDRVSLADSPLLTEVHSSILDDFSRRFADRETLILGMVASEEVLAANMQAREGAQLDPIDLAVRLERNATEIKEIEAGERDGIVDLVVCCDFDERSVARSILTATALRHLGA